MFIICTHNQFNTYKMIWLNFFYIQIVGTININKLVYHLMIKWFNNLFYH